MKPHPLYRVEGEGHGPQGKEATTAGEEADNWAGSKVQSWARQKELFMDKLG